MGAAEEPAGPECRLRQTDDDHEQWRVQDDHEQRGSAPVHDHDARHLRHEQAVSLYLRVAGSWRPGLRHTGGKYYSLQTVAAAARIRLSSSRPADWAASGTQGRTAVRRHSRLRRSERCVDKSRVFVLGFSFGGMYSYSLSMTRRDHSRRHWHVSGQLQHPDPCQVARPDRLDAIDRDERLHLPVGTGGAARPMARSTSPSNTARITDAPYPTPFRRGPPAT